MLSEISIDFKNLPLVSSLKRKKSQDGLVLARPWMELHILHAANILKVDQDLNMLNEQMNSKAPSGPVSDDFSLKQVFHCHYIIC